MTRQKLLALALACAALPACSDGTGSRPSLQGQWVYRVRLDEIRGEPLARCSVSGVVKFQQSGASVSGQMQDPVILCVNPGVGVNVSDFDSTTTVSGSVQGDSVLLTMRGPGLAVKQSVRVLGDSLAGRLLDSGGGIVAGRRYPDSEPLGRTTVHVSGGATQTQELYARFNGPGLFLVPRFGISGLLLQPFNVNAQLSTGTFTVGGVGSAYHGYYAGPIVGGHHEPFVDFTSGSMTLTYVDHQIARGSIDILGAESLTGAAAHVQAEFVAIVDRFPGQF